MAGVGDVVDSVVASVGGCFASGDVGSASAHPVATNIETSQKATARLIADTIDLSVRKWNALCADACGERATGRGGDNRRAGCSVTPCPGDGARGAAPVEVLHDGQWVSGWLEAYRRDPEGWRGMVRYSPSPGAQYLQWRPAEQIRQRER